MTVHDYSRYLTPQTLAEEEAAWERQGDQPMHAQLVTAALPHPSATVVEWGCGTGRLAAKLPAEVVYHGVDANPLCLALARERRPSGIFHPCDLRGAAGLVQDADLICAFAVFKHFAWEEWPWLCLQFLSVAPRAIFSQAIGPLEDTGDSFVHQFVPLTTVFAVIQAAGHRILDAAPQHPGDPEWIFQTEIP